MVGQVWYEAVVTRGGLGDESEKVKWNGSAWRKVWDDLRRDRVAWFRKIWCPH